MRTFLASLALGSLGFGLWAQAPAEAPRPLIICHAGSLSAAFKQLETTYTQRTGVPVQDLAGGSVALVRRIASGQQACDLYASADFQNIDLMLKPAGLSGGGIRFAAGAMVLAYSTTSRGAGTIAAPGTFQPPAVPMAAADWYRQLAQPGVKIAGSHPFLDPGGYRADLIFQLAQAQYQVPGLYNDLLSNMALGGHPGGLGQTFDYQFSYEHGALAAWRAHPEGTVRYVRLPDEVNLGAATPEGRYARGGITIPGLGLPGTADSVRIPATRVTWGIAVMKNSANRDAALAFLELLLGSEGNAVLKAVGPEPLVPARAPKEDVAQLPPALQALVQPL